MPWSLLLLNTVFGAPLMSDLLGITNDRSCLLFPCCFASSSQWTEFFEDSCLGVSFELFSFASNFRVLNLGAVNQSFGYFDFLFRVISSALMYIHILKTFEASESCNGPLLDANFVYNLFSLLEYQLR